MGQTDGMAGWNKQLLKCTHFLAYGPEGQGDGMTARPGKHSPTPAPALRPSGQPLMGVTTVLIRPLVGVSLRYVCISQTFRSRKYQRTSALDLYPPRNGPTTQLPKVLTPAASRKACPPHGQLFTWNSGMSLTCL